MDGLAFAPHVRWRPSRRGLILAGTDEDALLLEHPRGALLPDLLHDGPDKAELAGRLGPPHAQQLVDELLETGVLATAVDLEHHNDSDGRADVTARGRRSWQLTRSGLELTGIARPAAWLDRTIVPMLRSRPGRLLLLGVLFAGAASLLAGRPDVPAVSGHPVAEALVGLAVMLACTAGHELAHAVALVHYGRRPRRAGFGFYWGGISFYVDSTEALTLPRRARVVQALVGLGVDSITLSLLAIVAQLAPSTFVVALCWRLAVVALIDLITNLLPILELDGHWALADYLDEPELARRARAALGDLLRRRPTTTWLAVYGAVSLVGGLLLLAGGTYVWWLAAADLVTTLFDSNLGGVLTGLLLVVPLAVGGLLSATGLVLDVAAATPTSETPPTTGVATHSPPRPSAP